MRALERRLWSVLSVVVSLAWCAPVQGAEGIRFISHRGESLDAPENTMAAFRLAVARGTAGFECDVYRTADNEIVCIHDATTTRTTDGSLTVSNATLAELKALDAGSWKGPQFAGERIPTLSEALALAQDDFQIYVEIKCGTEILPRLVEVMAAEPKATPERIVFISFSSSVIAALRQQYPAYRAYWLTSITSVNGSPSRSAASIISTLQSINASGVDLSCAFPSLLDSAYVDAIKTAGYSFHVWTINDASQASAYAALGAETITTDCGAALAAQLTPRSPLAAGDTVFDPGNNVTQIVDEVISGLGGVVVNPASAGGGVVILNAANTYVGATALGCGTLVAASFADAGWPSSVGSSAAAAANLILGNGTLRYAGPAVTTDRGYTVSVNPANPNSAAVLHADGDIKFLGNINTVFGSFIKSGTGTVTYAGAGSNQMSRGGSQNLGSVINFQANGDSPTVGYSGFNVAAGKVILGANPAQTNYYTAELVVGTRTTTAANREVPAYLDFVGGVHYLGSFLAIGRANGTTTTAPGGLASRVAIYGGYVKVDNVSMGYSAGLSDYNARPVLDVFDGTLDGGFMRIGDHAGGHPTVNLYGGTTKASSFTAGLYGATDTRINLYSNALFDVAVACNLANTAGASCILALHGGTLKARGVFDANAGGNGKLYLNGGKFEARAAGGEGVAASVQAVVSTNGAVFDTGAFTFMAYAGLEHDAELGAAADGGLVKSGSGTLVLLGANTYTGPTTISNGTLNLTGTLPDAADVTVCGGATLSLTNRLGSPVPIGALTVGSEQNLSPGALELAAASGASSSFAASGVSVAGHLGIRLVQPGTASAVSENGTFELLSFPDATPVNASVVNILNPAPGKTYRFAVADAGAGRDRLEVTVSDAPAASTWIDAAGGSWTDADNWSPSAPANAAGTPVLFTTAAQAGGAAVTLPGEAVIGSLVLNSAEPYTFGGTGPLVLDNGGAGAVWSVSNGNHRVETGVRLDGTAVLATLSNAAQTVSGVISGNGDLWVNPAAAGGGTVTNSGANTYAGATVLGCGRLVATTLADGGQPSSIGASPSDADNLILGPGTLRYTGGNVATDRGFTINAGAGKAAVFSADADVTFSGRVQTVSGAFIKAGPGTLTLAGSGDFVLGPNSGGFATFSEWPANGDSPANGFPGLDIVNGKMVWGRDGQSVTVPVAEVWVGGWTTGQAGKETTGELEILGGTTLFSGYLSIGRNNGDATTAPTPLRPKVTIRGGNVTVQDLCIGYHNMAAQNTRPELEMFGGVLQVNNFVRLGNQKGDAAALATITMRGGSLRHPYEANGFSFGFTYAEASDGTLNMFGGLVDEGYQIQMGKGLSTSRLNLHGGVLRAQNIAGGNGNEYLFLNGGVFQPTGNGTVLAGLTAATVSTNGAVIDTSLAGASGFIVNQALLHDAALGGAADGGLVKLGTGLLVVKAAGHTFSGPALVSNGALRVEGVALKHAEVRVSSGASIQVDDFAAAAQVGNLVLGESGNTTPAALDLPLNAATLQYAGLTVTNALNAHQVRVGFHAQGGTSEILPAGVYTVLTYKATSPAPDPAAFSANPAFASKGAAFAVADGAAGWKCVVMAVTNVTAASAWKTAGDGAWETDANWTVPPPNQAGASVFFTNAIPASGAAVSLAGAKTAGLLTFDAANSFTLSGGSLTLANEGQPERITTLRGSHTLASDVQLTYQPEFDSRAGATQTVSGVISGNASLSVNPLASGGGRVTLSGANTYTGVTKSGCGTLVLTSLADGGQPSAAGASSADPANLTWGAGTLRYEGPEAVTDRGFKTTAPSGRAAILSVDTNVTFGGAIACASGSFIKRGKGTVTYTGTGAFTLSVHSGTAATFPGYPANGDSPTAGFYGFLIADGKMVWGRPGQTCTINNEAWIGSTTTTLAGQETTGELEIRGGYTRVNSYFCLGRNNGNPTTTGPVPLRPRLAILSGTLSVLHFIHCYDSSSQHYTRPVLDLYGGTLQVDGQFRMGNNRGTAEKPSVATVNIYGGTLLHAHATEGITFGWVNPAPEGIFNVFGGLVDEAAQIKMGRNFATSRLNLHGGVVKAQNITADNGSEHLFFNGGVFRPTGASQTLSAGFTSATVSTNGACFDTSLAGGGLYTLAQPLAHDAALGSAPDGGLVKSGANTLVLSVTNAFTGPVTVGQGTLRATVDGAVPDTLHVGAGAVFDANGATRAIPRVTGTGLLSNGTVRVTAQVNPGAATNSAPGAALTFANLTLAAGATVVCNTTTNGLPSGTNDMLAVTGLLRAEGGGYIDFGRTEEDRLEFPYSAVVMTYGTCDSAFTGWRARGTGYPAGSVALRVIRDESGPVKTVRVELLRSGTLIMMR